MAIPKTMKAAILVEQHRPLVIDEVELPQSLEVGQVLVKVHFSGICGSQLGEIDGAKGEDKFLPHLLGHEASGTVMEVGPGVRHVKPGDTVVVHWRKGLGIEGNPPSYRWRGDKLNAGWITTFNEYAIVAENRVTTIPLGSDLEVAALFGCAVTTGFGVVENNAKIRIGETVVVFGAGGIGLNIVQAAALAGAHPVIAVDLYDNRLNLARSLGATHTINANMVDAFVEIRSLAGGNQVDVFIDNTGQPGVIESGYTITKPQGRIILVGVPKKSSNIQIHSLPLHFGKSLIGSHGGEAVPHSDIARYFKMYQANKIVLDALITDRFPLDSINTAIERMRTGQVAGRCLVQLH
jgi:S-(hydroxymethyl)glutathione dehydrogenase/alcohol dehydrogenase